MAASGHLLLEVAPDTWSGCTHWRTNDCDGLDDADSSALAEILEARINDQSIESYALRCVSAINMMPKERCSTRNGTGIASACSGYCDIFTGQIIQANLGGGSCFRCTGRFELERLAAIVIENVSAMPVADLKDEPLTRFISFASRPKDRAN